MRISGIMVYGVTVDSDLARMPIGFRGLRALSCAPRWASGPGLTIDADVSCRQATAARAAGVARAGTRRRGQRLAVLDDVSSRLRERNGVAVSLG